MDVKPTALHAYEVTYNDGGDGDRTAIRFGETAWHAAKGLTAGGGGYPFPLTIIDVRRLSAAERGGLTSWDITS